MKTLKKIFTEMIPVVLGILIALLINNWKENADDERFINRVLQSIEKEMKSNEADFANVIPMHYALIDTIDRYMNDENISLTDIIIKGNGLQAATVKNASWNSFLNTKLELIDYETISILAEIDEAKHFLNSKFNKLMDFILENSESTDVVRKKMLKLQILNLTNSEEGLINLYQEYLKQNKKTNH